MTDDRWAELRALHELAVSYALPVSYKPSSPKPSVERRRDGRARRELLMHDRLVALADRIQGQDGWSERLEAYRAVSARLVRHLEGRGVPTSRVPNDSARADKSDES